MPRAGRDPEIHVQRGVSVPSISIERGCLADVMQVADGLRQSDIDELMVTSGDPVGCVIRSWAMSSYRRVFFVHGAPAGVFGVAPNARAHGEGVPWMVATPEIGRVPREFLVKSAREIEKMRAGYVLLRNAAHESNHLSLAWLAWLGFDIDHTPVGPGGVLRVFSMLGLPGIKRED